MTIIHELGICFSVIRVCASSSTFISPIHNSTKFLVQRLLMALVLRDPTPHIPGENGNPEPFLAHTFNSLMRHGRPGASSKESFFEIGIIGNIVRTTGLPVEYLDCMQVPRLASIAKKAYHVTKSSPMDSAAGGEYSSRTCVHPALVEEIQSLPPTHLFSQAMLLRDPNGRTAMMSIAEAAFAQLGGLSVLLELLVLMIENTLREKSKVTLWQLTWQQLLPENTPSNEKIRPGPRNLVSPHETAILYPPSPQDNAPSFMKTENLHVIEDTQGSPLNVEIHAKIGKGFFHVDSDQVWTCYRRNYFSVTCSYSLDPFHGVNFEHLHLRHDDGHRVNLDQIQALAMCVSAKTDGQGYRIVDLVQHTSKRDEGPISSPQKVKLVPHQSEASLTSGLYSQSPDYGPVRAPSSPIHPQNQTMAVFDRISFKNATANNGKGRLRQQYFHLLAELFAEVLDSGTLERRWIKVASRMSNPIIVRGGYPGHYAKAGAGASRFSLQGQSATTEDLFRSMQIRSHGSGPRNRKSVPGQRTYGAQNESSVKDVDDGRNPQDLYEPVVHLIIRKEGFKWFVVTRFDCKSKDAAEEVEIVLQWLEVALGSDSEKKPICDHIQAIDLEQENTSLESYNDESNDGKGLGIGCWRSKIRGGQISLAKPLEVSVGDTKYRQSARHTSAVTRYFPYSTAFSTNASASTSPFSLEDSTPTSMGPRTSGPNPSPTVTSSMRTTSPFPDLDDVLILTAAALWSLFDNSVQRMPNCQCTFKSEGGDYIQCKRRHGTALLWHIFTSEGSLCRGLRCLENLRVALGPKEDGDRLFTTSLCILGWTAESRTTPGQPIASKFSVTSGFMKGRIIKYEQESIEAQAHLSVPTVVTPQLSFATTFSKRRYKVANSIDEDSITATNLASTSIVLIYCETRGLHLMMYGADLIEGICVELLKKLLCAGHPEFFHNSTLGRIRTWQNSSFVSATENVIPGEELVRQAAKRINKLIESTNTAAMELNGRLSYWVLEHLLCGHNSQALKAPSNHIHTSWHTVAKKSPPLILVVGEIDARLISQDAGPLQWTTKSRKRKRPEFVHFIEPFVMRKSLTDARYGAVLGTKETLTRWLHQVGIAFCGRIQETNDRVRYGNGVFEDTYHVLGGIEGIGSAIPASIGCITCHHDVGVHCLHYLQ